MSRSQDDPVLSALSRLQRPHDEELEAAAESASAKALFESITADQQARVGGRAAGSRWRRALRLRGPAAIAAAVVLGLAGGAGAILVHEDRPPTRNELRAGASDGVLDPAQRYVNVPVEDSATPAELRREFERRGLDIELRLVPASPLLAGRILSASGSGGGELIRELRRDCPELTPCGKQGLKVPVDFSGHAVIVLGREPKGGERYVHITSFAGGCIHIVGRKAGKAESKIASHLWSDADPIWFDVDSGRTYQDVAPVRGRWVVDAIKVGGSLDEPKATRSPRVALAVSRKRAAPAKPIRSGPLHVYQQITQQGC